MSRKPCFGPVFAIAVAAALPGAARAETWNTCAGFIDSLPAVLVTQGTWCLRKDLSTPQTSGDAITIAANNITIDCNGYKVGGLGGGTGTTARGIVAENRLNATVRNCGIRGFMTGLELTGLGGGHLVEDNRFDANRTIAMMVQGDGSLVRGNRILDTGGSDQGGVAYGIYTMFAVDVHDNIIDVVTPDSGDDDDTSVGIYVLANDRGTVRGNRVSVVDTLVGAGPYGIYLGSLGRMYITGNLVTGPGSGTGINCQNANTIAKDNMIIGFTIPTLGCTVSGNLP